MTKELVELHYGTIKVKSEPNKGTTFIVKLPVGKEHFRDVQEEEEQISSPLEKQDNGMFLNEDTSESVKSIEEYLPQSPFDREEAVRSPVSGLSAPILLIVEDNADMRTYIRGHLSSEFQIDEAKDGAEGLQKALSIIPDLVISDIMMPVMDGYQLCEKLKTDQRTSHIPVILLTARAAKEDKLEGLETGADDYINKPFDADELKVRIKNLIAQRKLLKERFSSEALFPASEIAVTSTDKKFMDKAMKIIEQNLDNPDFTINILSDQIGMSREHFSRKVKALTNQPPHMFIRLMRLKRAAVLLKHHTGNVTEVAFDVGFKNLSHFAKSFREQFGITPSHFSDHN